jgi:diguanylate cyclase (GGDEF)-like protein/PAS domain S-box-containing protein
MIKKPRGNQPMPDTGGKTAKTVKRISPMRLLLVLVATVFTVEMLVMLALPLFPRLSELQATLLDATSLVVIIFPVFYLLVVRPVRNNIEALSRLEQLRRDNEATLHTLLDNLPYQIWLKDSDGRFLAVNEEFARTCNLPAADIVGKKDTEILPPEATAQYRMEEQEIMASGAPKYSEETIIENGQKKWLEVFRTPILGEYRQVLGITSLSRDITERKHVEEQLRLAALIYQSSSEAIMVTDEDNNIVDVNPAFSLITGYAREEIAGKNPRFLQSGKQGREFYRQMWQTLFDEGRWHGELWNRRKNGELYAQWASLSLIRHPDGKIYRHVAQFSDITDRKLKDDLIWKQANFDPLTKLPNRRLFQDRLGQELKKAHRVGHPVALLFIDLDRFKEINDTLGHAQGDQLLAEAALRILGCVRETDTVARLGGDEFTVILPEFGSTAHVERIAQNIIRQLGSPFSLGNGEIGYVSASIGITLYPDDATDMQSLFKHADQAMYVAKAEGRNQFSYFTPSMQKEAHEKMLIGNDLRQALVQNQLEIYFQPIVEAASGQIVKAEALLRWHHPQRGLVSPAVFIPLAEEYGLIREIGEWVFREAIISVERWRRQFGRLIQVSVNKSPVQFMDKLENDGWIASLAAMELPGNSVAVEITEGLLLNESAAVQERLLEFRNNGIEVSVDDFGTGFSSLSYLKRFDIDYLKIDRSFIRDLTEDESDKALTEAIIVMAHKLGIKAIAEGVETVEQRDLLLSFGCDFFQGSLFSSPVPEEQFRQLLDQREIHVH